MSMLDLSKVSDANLPQTIRFLKYEFLKRGWSAKILHGNSSHIFVDKNDGSVPFHIFGSAPHTTSFAAGLLANDKYGTYQLLSGHGIVQPATILVRDLDVKRLEEAKSFLNKFEKVVVKPVNGGHGKGITVGVDTDEKLLDAIAKARHKNRDSSRNVLVQQMINASSLDVRILCIGYKFVAAVHRVPASVTGDGEHTVAELIEQENNTFRGKAYYAELATIDLDSASKYLGNEIYSVPKHDEGVQVLGIANYGSGGKLIDVTDDMPKWLIRGAEFASKCCGLPVCGVDYLVSEINKDAGENTISAYIIEVNKAPSLALHEKPTIGKRRNVVEKYVDYLDRAETI